MKKLTTTLLLFLSATFAHASQLHKDVLTATLILEAGGEGYHGMVAVANVIDNRAHKYGISHYKVVRKPKQFSSHNGRTTSRVIALAKNHPKWNEAAKIVNKMLTGNLVDITHGADHFVTVKTYPAWAKKMKITCYIKGHKFYRS